MLCIAIKPATYEELEAQAKAAEKAGDMIEIRVDSLPCINLRKLNQIIQAASRPIILTLRSKKQGGFWSGSADEMQNSLSQLIELNPDFLDIESHLPKEFVEKMQRLYPRVKIVLSHHDFVSTPPDLYATLDKMRKTRADIYKLAATANSTLDALKILHFSKIAGENVIAIGMGIDGEITRILAPVVNSPWTYASLTSATQTAPGQISCEQLQNVYHYSSLNLETAVCCLIGNPVAFSIGEIFHNAAYRQLGFNAVYIKMRVLPDELKECLEYCGKLHFRGISVTIPHKEEVMKYLLRVDGPALKMGAVNTLTYVSDKGYVGGNTDAAGALDAIEKYQTVNGRHLAIVGAGGSSRAIAYEGKRRGARITVAARRLMQAEQIGKDLNVEYRDLKELPLDYDILVNATPSELPIDPDAIIPGTVVMDLKAKPFETLLLSKAKERDCRVIPGIEMFNRQAEMQIQRWFGECAYFL